LFIEATAVEADGRITPGCLGLWDDANEAALAPVVAAIRRYFTRPPRHPARACRTQGIE